LAYDNVGNFIEFGRFAIDNHGASCVDGPRLARENVACRIASNEKVAEHWTFIAGLVSLIGNEKINEDEIVIDH